MQDSEPRTFREAIESKETYILQLVGLSLNTKEVGCKEIFKST